MAKIIIIFFAIFLIGGCAPNKTADNKGGITITIWENYGNEEHELFVKLIEEYDKKHPNIHIKVSRIPWVGHEAKYRTALTVNSTPDIGRIDTGFLAELASNNAIYALNEFGADGVKGEYLEAAINSNIYRGKIYGLPDQITGVCLFYNKDLFRAAGLDPNKPPKTWTEFIEYAKRLTIPEKNQYGFGMNNSLWWSFPFFNTFGAKFLSNDHKTCLLNSKEGIEALRLKVDLYRKYKVEGGAWISGAINPEVGFLNKRYAMIFMGPWNVKNFKNAGINFGVSLIPAGPKGSSTNVGGSNLVIFKSCKHPEIAYKILRYITGKYFQTKWALGLSQIPTNLRAYKQIDKKSHPILSVFMEQMKLAIARPPLKNYGKIEEIINPEMEAALLGKKVVEDALNTSVKRINNEVLQRE